MSLSSYTVLQFGLVNWSLCLSLVGFIRVNPQILSMETRELGTHRPTHSCLEQLALKPDREFNPLQMSQIVINFISSRFDSKNCFAQSSVALEDKHLFVIVFLIFVVSLNTTLGGDLSH